MDAKRGVLAQSATPCNIRKKSQPMGTEMARSVFKRQNELQFEGMQQLGNLSKYVLLKVRLC